MLPANKIVNLRRRVNRARRFPDNTCGASRHLQMIADHLSSKRNHPPLEECWDAEHMAGSMYAVLESLWRARTELKRLKTEKG